MGTLLNFMKKVAIITAVLSAIAFVLVGIFSPIEPGMSIFGHALKTFVGWLFVTVILETIMYSFGQFLYGWIIEKKERHGKWWFWKGVWEDIKRVKRQITWKRVGIVVAFFAIVLALIYVLELIVP